MATFPPRAYKALAKKPGTIYLPKIGPIDPATIKAFHSSGAYTLVYFKDQKQPKLLTWGIALFIRQLPTWQVKSVPTGPHSGRMKQLLPA